MDRQYAAGFQATADPYELGLTVPAGLGFGDLGNL